MKKIHNERNAGRKPKYIVPTKLLRVPEPIIQQVLELSTPFTTEYLKFNKLK
ncbi:MAG: hypothetical protein H7239_10340 [Flavobacterium sp.]|nr:hypothetical protein [Flavobacterium sp.]